MPFGDQKTNSEKILDELKDLRYENKIKNMSARDVKYESEPSMHQYERIISFMMTENEYSLEEAEEIMFTEWALGPDDSETPKEKRYHELRVKIAEKKRRSLEDLKTRNKCKPLVVKYRNEGLDLEQAFRKIHQDGLDSADDLKVAWASKMIKAIELAKSDLEAGRLRLELEELGLSVSEIFSVLHSYRLKTMLAVYGFFIFGPIFLVFAYLI